MSSLSAIATSTSNESMMIFPSAGMQLLSALIEFLGVSILAHCLSRRITSEELSSLRAFRSLTWARLCILLVFLDSWLFLFTSGILIFGIGLDRGSAMCSFSIYTCIAFYGSSKFFIYCFLIEKVHVVWAPTSNTKRCRSPVYIISAVTVALYAVVTALMYIGRVHYFREDGVCVTGVDLFASVPLLSYDLYVSVFLTSLFLWPLVKTGRIDPLLRRVAKRTLLAAAVSLTTSTANVLVLTLQHGKELGWVCLGSCGADVLCNALALFWVTQRTRPLSINVDAVDSDKSHSVIFVNPEESFPTFVPKKDISAERKGHLNQGHRSIHNSDISIPPMNQGQARLHSPFPSRSRSSPLPWSVESVVGCFRSKEQEEPQSEVCAIAYCLCHAANHSEGYNNDRDGNIGGTSIIRRH
ncbi:hypothetical protein PILCRDRAFT_781610 [Piloderma croceum F 1598]|uniref:Uncharacterized protein n=1 Tax=Piloderma croceum (strain F 1598) TaxID=765440 RepID=A0A0C3BDD0_PILCF|nr:hypothetical protein PILCRDRAFT_781610 [Piloderma croceum F 1598]